MLLTEYADYQLGRVLLPRGTPELLKQKGMGRVFIKHSGNMRCLVAPPRDRDRAGGGTTVKEEDCERNCPRAPSAGAPGTEELTTARGRGERVVDDGRWGEGGTPASLPPHSSEERRSGSPRPSGEEQTGGPAPGLRSALQKPTARRPRGLRARTEAPSPSQEDLEDTPEDRRSPEELSSSEGGTSTGARTPETTKTEHAHLQGGKTEVTSEVTSQDDERERPRAPPADQQELPLTNADLGDDAFLRSFFKGALPDRLRSDQAVRVNQRNGQVITAAYNGTVSAGRPLALTRETAGGASGSLSCGSRCSSSGDLTSRRFGFGPSSSCGSFGCSGSTSSSFSDLFTMCDPNDEAQEQYYDEVSNTALPKCQVCKDGFRTPTPPPPGGGGSSSSPEDQDGDGALGDRPSDHDGHRYGPAHIKEEGPEHETSIPLGRTSTTPHTTSFLVPTTSSGAPRGPASTEKLGDEPPSGGSSSTSPQNFIHCLESYHGIIHTVEDNNDLRGTYDNPGSITVSPFGLFEVEGWVFKRVFLVLKGSRTEGRFVDGFEFADDIGEAGEKEQEGENGAGKKRIETIQEVPSGTAKHKAAEARSRDLIFRILETEPGSTFRSFDLKTTFQSPLVMRLPQWVPFNSALAYNVMQHNCNHYAEASTIVLLLLEALDTADALKDGVDTWRCRCGQPQQECGDSAYAMWTAGMREKRIQQAERVGAVLRAMRVLHKDDGVFARVFLEDFSSKGSFSRGWDHVVEDCPGLRKQRTHTSSGEDRLRQHI